MIEFPLPCLGYAASRATATSSYAPSWKASVQKMTNFASPLG